MKKLLITDLIIISLFISFCGNQGKGSAGEEGKSPDDTGSAKIVFRDYEHDFGKVSEGEKVAFVFQFTNQGSASLVITSATTTCGCTVSEYDSRPVPPEGHGNIGVEFDTSGRNGRQTKTITVKSNASKPVVLLKITGEVINKDK